MYMCVYACCGPGSSPPSSEAASSYIDMMDFSWKNGSTGNASVDCDASPCVVDVSLRQRASPESPTAMLTFCTFNRTGSMCVVTLSRAVGSDLSRATTCLVVSSCCVLGLKYIQRVNPASKDSSLLVAVTHIDLCLEHESWSSRRRASSQRALYRRQDVQNVDNSRSSGSTSQSGSRFQAATAVRSSDTSREAVWVYESVLYTISQTVQV